MKSSQPAAGALLREVTRQYARAQRTLATGCGTSAAQCHILGELRRGGAVPLVELGRQLGLEKSGLSRAIDHMAGLGLLRKARNPADARSVLVSLTAAGRHRGEQLDRRLTAHARQLMGALGARQRAQFERSLQTLAVALRDETSPPAGVVLRTATAADWPAIARLLRSLALPLAGARVHLRHFTVAMRGTRLLGCAAVEPRGSVALLRSVAVSPGARGIGLGAQLTRRAAVHARRQGARSLYLLTTSAADYFRHMGFGPQRGPRVPAALQASEEFRGACPATAIRMRADLRSWLRAV